MVKNGKKTCGTTAFGKTVAAIKIIAERKVNTLILVNKVSLVSQWKEKLSLFLTVNEQIITKGKRESKSGNIFGQIGGGKQSRNGIIDIAIMQSLSRMGEVEDFVKNYGMVIVDECHHVPAFSFESILKKVTAKYDREILIVSPFVTKRRTQQIIRDLEPVHAKKVKITVVTRPAEDFQTKDLTAWTEAIQQIETAGIHLVFKL